MNKFRMLSLLVLLALVFGGVTAALAHGGDVNLIHACVRNASGAVRIIPANGTCKPWEHALDWGIIGPPGPQGEQGEPGDSVLANLACTTDQIIKWDGNAWVCADNIDNDTLASLNCTVNQTIGWDGNAWVCRSAPIVATLSRVAGAPGCCGIPDVFQAYSPNVNPDRICDDFLCEIELVDVVDHTSCQVSLSGNSGANLVDILPNTDYILLILGFNLNPSEPFYVNVSCAT